MLVLQHKHPLTLIDLNPKYPYDEEVYDDEEDLIFKQSFDRPCDLCDKKITYIHRYYYSCNQCDYSLHKLCAELPITLEHASHSVHTLTLFLDKSQWQCHVCKKIPSYNPLCYRCSICIYNICLDCGIDEVQYHTLYHPSHQHPLVPVSRQRHILAECDACGKKHEGIFYECSTCFRSLIHNDCVLEPKRLLIQDSTCGDFSHTHPLILSYSFPEVHQKAKFYPTCRVCDNSFSGNENLWVYKCEKCRFYVHLGCANSHGRLIKSVKGERFPLTGQPYKLFADIFFKERKLEMSITHNSHEHPLILVDITSPMNTVQDLCNGCVTPITAMPFYKCTYDGCDFVLHDWCTRLPTKIKGHKYDLQHTLTLLTKLPPWFKGLFICDNCNRFCNGFAYACVECNIIYFDVYCALVISRSIRHKSHPRHLLKMVQYERVKNYCRVCLSGFYDKETSFSCKDCEFHLHLGCAFLLPETIRHKYDKHPMTISYSPVENHWGDYFCEVCEEELNPNACFYHCYKCMQSIHLSCAPILTTSPLIPKIKACIDYAFAKEGVTSEENIKPGSIHKTEDHPHPLTLLEGTETDGHCLHNKCGRKIWWHDLIFKCLQCDYKAHYYHSYFY